MLVSNDGVCTISADDPGADYAALINAALADPSIHTVILEAGEYLLHSPIFVPSDKTLLGAGRDATVLRAAADFDRPNPGEADGVVNSDYGAVGVKLADFSIDASKLMPDGFRLVGCFMRQATDFDIDRVDVYNTTAYGHFAQGNPNDFSAYASGTYDDCAVYNAQIAFEQMTADGITLTNCFAGDGDGDLVGTYFHPLTGSKNITYINCTAIGFGDAGFELTANLQPLENIQIINSSVTMLGNGAALVAAGGVTDGLIIVGSSFVAYGNAAALLYGVIGSADGATFQGEGFGAIFYSAPDGTLSQFNLTDSSALGIQSPGHDGAAYGVGGDGEILWDGGTIEARGALGLMFPLGSTGIAYSPDTVFVADGYDAVLLYTRNAGEMSIAPDLGLDMASLGALEGGTLTISFHAGGSSDDRLAILNEGTGPGQIGFDGAQVTYSGTVIGTVAGGTHGDALEIHFGAAVTGDAVAALVHAITYANDANGYLLYRAVTLAVTDADGGSQTADLAILLSENQAPFVSSHTEGQQPLDYAENDAPSPLIALATVIDLDSPDFAGGKLVVSIDQGAFASDRLTVLSKGDAAGQIRIVGNEVRYEGVRIGTMSGGTDGSTPLVISFEAAATTDAVQALLRSIAFSNQSGPQETGPRTISFTLSDGDGATGLTNHIALEVAAGNDTLIGGALPDTFYGGDGADYLAGGGGNDLLHGDAGNDTLIGQDGNDFAYGGAGLDTLYGGQGSDYLNGEADADVLYGQEGNDTLIGQGGDDFIEGGDGDDTLYGGEGTDFLKGGNGADVLYGQEGDETLVGGDGNDALDGGAGADTLYGGEGNDYLLGGIDADRLFGEVGNDTLLGGVGDDSLDGGTGEDALYGGDGADYLQGGGDGDRLYGEAANDTLLGQDGSDTLDGGAGDDNLYAGVGSDYLLGGAGNDQLFGEDGNDTLLGEDGLDRLDGGAGVDLLIGGAGDDFLTGGADGDTIYGDSGIDRLFGDAGNDFLRGGDGNDALSGGDGDDVLAGGLGADVLEGGAGRDWFVFESVEDSRPQALDLIVQFEKGEVIDLGAIDADTGRDGNNSFSFIGSEAFSGQAGQLRAFAANGAMMVEADVNGDGVADFAIMVTTPDNQPLTSADFIL